MKNSDLEESKFGNIRYSFIIGLGRSGTNLLSKLFNQQKSVLTSIDIEFVIFFHHSFSKKRCFEKTDFKLICEYFELYSYYQPILKELIDTEKLYNDLCNQSFANYADLTKFLHLQFNFFNKPIDTLELIIDKNPSYSLHVSTLLKLDSRAKFICLVRDYRANILSRKQSVEHRSPNTAFNCYRWFFYNRRILKQAKRKEQLLIAKYEDLAINPEGMMEEFVRFLGIAENQPNYYSQQDKDKFFNQTNKSINNRYENIISNLESPVYTTRINAWEKELSQKDKELCEAICGELGKQFGYEVSQNLSSSKKLYLKAISFHHFLRASYDYYKEFYLYFVSPRIKLMRIRQKIKQLK